MTRYDVCGCCGDEIARSDGETALRACAECGVEACERCLAECGCACGLRLCAGCGFLYEGESWTRSCLEDVRANLVEQVWEIFGDLREVERILGSDVAAHHGAPHQHRCHGHRRAA